jgi:RNA polymerase sigma-70 factor (family 1)
MQDDSKHSEEKIIHRLRKGESSAFDEVYYQYSRNVYRFAYSFLKIRQDAEEVMQEVFLRVWRNRSTLNEYYSLKAYLFSISYNVIIDEFRKRLKDSKYKEFLVNRAELSNLDTENSVAFSELNERYTSAVEHLPEKRKKIYKLHREDGLSYKEIADKLNISPRTVENQISQALKYLRSKLGPETLSVILFYFMFIR